VALIKGRLTQSVVRALIGRRSFSGGGRATYMSPLFILVDFPKKIELTRGC
jgi:hypothetical protein